jgi:hypothetical protein
VEGKANHRLYAQRLVELSEEGNFTFTVGAPKDLEMRIELRNCSRDGMASIYHSTDFMRPELGNPDTLLLLDLPPSVYVVRLMLDNTESITLDVTVDVSVESWP